MPEDFQQTVDLRDKMEKRRRPASPAISARRRTEPVAPSAGARTNQAGQPVPLKKIIAPLEEIYQDRAPDEPKKDWQKISRPKAGRPREGLIKLVVFILAIIVLGATFYSLFFRRQSASPEPLVRDWYAVKLVDGEIFYGQITDIKADPVLIANVYYNYDYNKTKPAAAGEPSQTVTETGNIRLVKRGQETHGPDGSMNVVRGQILFMEPLKNDSKVLQAIMEHEK